MAEEGKQPAYLLAAPTYAAAAWHASEAGASQNALLLAISRAVERLQQHEDAADRRERGAAAARERGRAARQGQGQGEALPAEDPAAAAAAAEAAAAGELLGEEGGDWEGELPERRVRRDRFAVSESSGGCGRRARSAGWGGVGVTLRLCS